MKKPADIHIQRDRLKLICLCGVILGVGVIFSLTPSLSTPTILAMVVAILVSPAVAWVEGRGHSRGLAALYVVLAMVLIIAFFSAWGIQATLSEWGTFSKKVPDYFTGSLEKLKAIETALKAKYNFLSSSHITESVLAWGSRTGDWFAVEGPTVMSKWVSWIFLVPPITVMLLSEGPTLRRKFYSLVPNRYFESFFLMSTGILRGLSDYLRAKLLEATLICFLTSLALMIVGAPYALVLGLLAGVTNIIPYIGPFIGAIPGVLIAGFDAPNGHMAFTVAAIYIGVNLLDMVVIFPVVVAKLVNLHPMILIAVVGIGQKYYGLVGMLISIPIATILKVILSEIYSSVYEYCPNTASTNPYEEEAFGAPTLTVPDEGGV